MEDDVPSFFKFVMPPSGLRKLSSDEDEDEDYDDDDESSDDQEEELEIVGSDKGKGVNSPAYIKAEAFHCDHPSFTVAMNISYLEKDYRLWIPVLHGNEYLNRATQATLLVGTRAWTVNVKRGNGCFMFTAGWASFVHANRLEVEDVCKFELVDRRAHAYRVHIFRRDY